MRQPLGAVAAALGRQQQIDIVVKMDIWLGVDEREIDVERERRRYGEMKMGKVMKGRTSFKVPVKVVEGSVVSDGVRSLRMHVDGGC